MKRSLLAVFLILSAFLSMGSLAQEAALNCEPEGTDTWVEYGDTVSCVFENTGDLDVYRFMGNAGDQPLIQVSSDSRIVSVYLYDSKGQLSRSNIGTPTATITGYNLPEDGTYTILAGLDTGSSPVSYTLEFPCLFGSCVVNPPPNGTGGLAGWSGGVAVDFGAKGLWNYDGTQWKKLTSWDAGSGGMDGWSGGLAVDFDANGTWNYDGTTWRRLTTWSPSSAGLSGWADEVAVDFEGEGVWSNDGTSWRKLTSWNAESADSD